MVARKAPSDDPKINARRARGRELMKAYRAKNPEFAQRDRDRSREFSRSKMLAGFGLTEADFQNLLVEQRNACAICGNQFTVISGGRSRAGKVHVDHDHATGKVRGLLCMQCNALLGNARDNLTVLAGARDYLSDRGINAPRRGWSGSVTGKVWGATSTLIKNPFIELHRISVLPNAQCSLHLHKHKSNTFILLSGKLFIDVHKNDYPLVDTTEMGEGDVVTVRPGENHRFRTGGAGAQALEIYSPQWLEFEDIVRQDAGSIVTKTSREK